MTLSTLSPSEHWPPPPSLVILHLYCSLACRMSLLFRSAEPMWCWLMEYYSHKWDLQKGIKILGDDMTESTEVKEVIGMFGCGKSMQEFCLLSFASHRGHECQGSHARTRLWSSVCPDAAPESRESMDIPRTDRQSGKQYYYGDEQLFARPNWKNDRQRRHGRLSVATGAGQTDKMRSEQAEGLFGAFALS